MTEVAIVRMPQGDGRYDLVESFLKLRKHVFMDRMSWPLFEHDTIEFEQYDTFHAVYVIAHEEGEVIGGARLIRTDHRIGKGKVRYTYMIRDAYEGILPGLPEMLCDVEPPICPQTWELTRLVTVAQADLAEVLLNAANDFLFAERAKRCLFLGPPAFLRMARRMGYTPERLGPTVRNPDGAFLAFSCDVLPRRHPRPTSSHQPRSPRETSEQYE